MDTDTKKSFKQECKVINLELEYEGYVGNELYAIITDLSKEELNKSYGAEIEKYKPFIILSRAMGLAMKKHEHDEKKHAMREARGEMRMTGDVRDEALISALTEDDDQLVKEAIVHDFMESLRINAVSKSALMTLTPLQRDYLIRKYVNRESVRDIADKDGKRFETVWDIIVSAKNRYIKAVKALEVA